MTISTNKRLQEIVSLLEKYEYVKATDLAKKFNVSMETIRKDLHTLEERGIAKKEYGGASLSTLGVEKNIDYRKSNNDEKKEIGRLVKQLLKDKHSLILDSGSTCLAAIEYINVLPSMDIITNSVRAFELLDGNLHNVFLTGGRKREKNQSMIGNWTETFLKSIHVDVCLLGTSGLLGREGPTVHSYQEITTKQIMIQQSDLVYVLAEHKKFQESGFHQVGDWSQIDGIVTSPSLPLKTYNQFIKKVDIIDEDLE